MADVQKSCREPFNVQVEEDSNSQRIIRVGLCQKELQEHFRLRTSLLPSDSTRLHPGHGLTPWEAGVVLTPAATANQVCRGEVQQDAPLHLLEQHATHPQEEGGHGQVADAVEQSRSTVMRILRSVAAACLPAGRTLVHCIRGLSSTQEAGEAHIRVLLFEILEPCT